MTAWLYTGRQRTEWDYIQIRMFVLKGGGTMVWIKFMNMLVTQMSIITVLEKVQVHCEDGGKDRERLLGGDFDNGEPALEIL